MRRSNLRPYTHSLLLLAAILGCSKAPRPDATASTDGSSPPASAASASPVTGWDSFGAGLSGEAKVVKVGDLLAHPDQYRGQSLRIAGTVDEVCKAKGCWMTLRGGDESMRVTFKDYGFFMPLDCEGREVLVDGTFEIATVPEAEVKHLLEDAGKHEEAVKHTGDGQEFRMVSTGVQMKPKGDA